MAKLKSRICQICKGKGNVKIKKDIHQCWSCQSEGEIDEFSMENNDIPDDDEYWNYVTSSIPKLN